MVDPKIVNAAERYLAALEANGLSIRFGVIFGSWTTGKADRWSDIDLLVVSPKFDTSISRDQVNLLWRVAAQSDSRIEPVPCGEKQWDEDTSSAIVEIARRQGQRVSLVLSE